MEVLGYNEIEDKYRVKVWESGIVKEVVRLSLIFNAEDKDLFNERVEIAKLRKATADDNIRFLKYLGKMDDSKVSSL